MGFQPILLRVLWFSAGQTELQCIRIQISQRKLQKGRSVSKDPFLLGEFHRALDERHRLNIPGELADPLLGGGPNFILAKERPGALSLWSAATWQEKLDSGVELVRNKIRSGRLAGRVEDVQRLGRMLSTRHASVEMDGRARLLIPEGFREFLAAEPGTDVVIVGAAVCVEIWRPDAWIEYLSGQIPEFRQLFDELAG